MASAAQSPGLRIGSLRGAPVFIGRSWPVIAIIIIFTFGPQVTYLRPDLGASGYLVAAAFAILLLLSVLVHEAAHALVAQARGMAVHQVVADAWGGHTSFDQDDTSPATGALVAVVGPLANAVLAGLGWLILQMQGDGSAVTRFDPISVPTLLLSAFVWANGFVAIFNLLPGLPLDGGYLVSSLVWAATGSRSRGSVVAGWCGRVVAVLAVLWAIGLPLLHGEQPSMVTAVWGIMIGGFLWFGASAAINRGQAAQVLGKVQVGQLLRPVFMAAAGTPLSSLPQNADIVVTAADGTPWGVVPAEISTQVRASQPGLAVESAALRQPEPWVAQVDSPQTDVSQLVRVYQASGGAASYLLVATGTGQVLGIVRTEDLRVALNAVA